MTEHEASGTATSEPAATDLGTDRDRSGRRSGRRTRGRRPPRRLLIAATAGGAATAAGIAVFGMSLQSPMSIADIEITGVSSDLRPQVDAALGVAAGDRFSSLDPGAAAERIGEIEGLDGASLRWSWWNTLAVAVDEQTPLGAVPALGGGFRVLDAAGETIRTVPERPQGLPLVEAADTAGRTTGLEILRQLPEGLRASTDAVAVDRSGRATLRTTSEATVILGDAADLPVKLRLAGQLLPGTGASVVNVSVPERPAVSGVPADAGS